MLIVGAWLGFALAVRERVVFPLQTLSNLLGALREGDFSVRGRSPRPDDALGEVMREVNTLGSTLREQRLGAMEATTLLRTVMREIDVAIFAFDENQRLRLVNRAGERLLAAPAERLLGQTAAELQLEVCLDGPAVTTLQTVFPGGAGRWGVRRTRIREHGLPLELVVISDLTQALSEQELHAWQRLVRVLGHELNNSLTPIKSIAGSLESIVARERAARRLARRYAPRLERHHVALRQPQPLHRRLCASGQTAAPAIAAALRGGLRGPRCELRDPPSRAGGCRAELRRCSGDPDQLEQVLINLLRNAADASLTTNGRVTVGWQRDTMVEIWVKDEGPGPLQHCQSLRPVLHHQARRQRHRAGAQPPDRRRPRRRFVARKPPGRPGLRRAATPPSVISSRASL